MKLLNTLLFLFFIGSAWAQQRYIDEIFTDVDVTTDVTYGVNATVLYLTVPQVGQAIPEPLIMDIYEPAGDTETERPVVIYFHTGNFLPQPDFCSVSGNRDDPVIIEIATRLAKRGYVVGVVDYRLGWNPIATTQEERTYTLINAAYRGVQDARTAIRYFKRNFVEEGNEWGVDTSKIALWGQGTGGYITLAAATLDQYSEILLPKFTVDFMGIPIPMVLEPVNGDIFGTSVGIVPIGTPPPLTAGDTLCYPNHVGYSSDFQLSVNMGGAIGDSSWIDEGDVPMITYHVMNDSNAPYTEGILIVPTTGDLVVEVQGGYVVQQKNKALGINDIFANYTWVDPYSTRANQLNDGADGLFPFEYPAFPNPLNPGDVITVSDPWSWWNPDDWDDVFCDLNPGIPLHQLEIFQHPDMSEAKGKLYVDTIMGYFLPRACLALDLGCDLTDYIVSSTEEALQPGQIDFSIVPNPASGEFVLRTNAENPMLDVFLFDLNGRMVDSYLNVRNNQLAIQRGNLPAGMYLVKIRVPEGVSTQRVVLR